MTYYYKDEKFIWKYRSFPMKEGNTVAFQQKKKKKIDKFLWNTENVATMLYKYIYHIKYIYDIGRNHRIDFIVFYIWNWIGMHPIYLNQWRLYMSQALNKGTQHGSSLMDHRKFFPLFFFINLLCISLYCSDISITFPTKQSSS